MPDTIRTVEYVSTLVANTPGQPFRVLSMLESLGVCLLACTGFPAADARRTLGLRPAALSADGRR